MKSIKCRFKGCKVKHKSTTGYCAEHANKAVKHVVRQTDSIGERLLVEEYDNPRWSEN